MGSPKYGALVWSGDIDSSFAQMKQQIKCAINMGVAGIPYWISDIGGFEGTAPADVYKRWLAFGLLSTHSRLHGSNSYRVPWLFGDEAVDVCRYFSKLKNSLMPYIFTNAVETSKTGVPSMRAMVMEFDDLGCEDCDRQYMLGDSLLVAPVLSEEGDVDYYLPAGEWTHLLTGETVQGGGWRHGKYDFFSLPLFVRENTILPIGACDAQPVYDYADGTVLHIYALKDSASRVICDSEGNEILTVKAERNGNAVSIKLNGKYQKMSIMLHGVSEAANLTGAAAKTENGAVVLTELTSEVKFDI